MMLNIGKGWEYKGCKHCVTNSINYGWRNVFKSFYEYLTFWLQDKWFQTCKCQQCIAPALHCLPVPPVFALLATSNVPAHHWLPRIYLASHWLMGLHLLIVGCWDRTSSSLATEIIPASHWLMGLYLLLVGWWDCSCSSLATEIITTSHWPMGLHLLLVGCWDCTWTCVSMATWIIAAFHWLLGL